MRIQFDSEQVTKLCFDKGFSAREFAARAGLNALTVHKVLKGNPVQMKAASKLIKFAPELRYSRVD